MPALHPAADPVMIRAQGMIDLIAIIVGGFKNSVGLPLKR